METSSSPPLPTRETELHRNQTNHFPPAPTVKAPSLPPPCRVVARDDRTTSALRRDQPTRYQHFSVQRFNFPPSSIRIKYRPLWVPFDPFGFLFLCVYMHFKSALGTFYTTASPVGNEIDLVAKICVTSTRGASSAALPQFRKRRKTKRFRTRMIAWPKSKIRAYVSTGVVLSLSCADAGGISFVNHSAMHFSDSGFRSDTLHDSRGNGVSDR